MLNGSFAEGDHITGSLKEGSIVFSKA
jgi:hypothetical protein